MVSLNLGGTCPPPQAPNSGVSAYTFKMCMGPRFTLRNNSLLKFSGSNFCQYVVALYCQQFHIWLLRQIGPYVINSQISWNFKQFSDIDDLTFARIFCFFSLEISLSSLLNLQVVMIIIYYLGIRHEYYSLFHSQVLQVLNFLS